MEQVRLVDIMQALSDPARLDIIRQLSGGRSMTCSELAPDRPKSSMSHHFKILRSAGLVETRTVGNEHFNRLRRDELDARFPSLIGTLSALN
jgi:DNA-binding transcriptional ArsR family regulator